MGWGSFLVVPEFYSVFLGIPILPCNSQASFFCCPLDSVLLGHLPLGPGEIQASQYIMYFESTDESVKQRMDKDLGISRKMQ